MVVLVLKACFQPNLRKAVEKFHFHGSGRTVLPLHMQRYPDNTLSIRQDRFVSSGNRLIVVHRLDYLQFHSKILYNL